MIWAPCGSLRLWGGGRWVGGHLGAWGGVPRHVYMHVHARTCTKHEDKHVRKLQMAANMEAAMFIMFNMHACMCARACMCMRACARVHMNGGVPPPNPTPTPTPTHPTPPPPPPPPTHPAGGVPPQISKNAIRLERIKIFRFRLKIWNLWRIPHLWMGVFLVGGWVDGWVSGSKDVKS